MTPYEQGFAQGEHQAFTDRRDRIVRQHPTAIESEFWRGYWDAYYPRGHAWSLVSPEPQAAWWQERESVELAA